jgi:acyl-CoA synthetase (NDP forming)
MTKFDEINQIFLPRNVAIIGSSPDEQFTKAMMRSNMKDHLYRVNPKYSEIKGRKCYASVLDIEGPVDYVVLTLPARFVLKTVEECIEKGVRVIHSFTSGFGETGLEEGIRMEKELSALIKGKIRLIGPNCMGIYCPKSGLTFNPASTNEEGHIGVITQSGTFGQAFIHVGRTRNIKVSKVVSYGNAIDLDCPDFLEYLADDPDTNIIALYIEGIKDGKRLMQALRYAAEKKPVFALKGGVTSQGGRVANSHTGALAGSGETWATVFKQTGVVQVNDIQDLINICECLNDSPLPKGRGVSIITYSGGFSVVQSDMCVKAGLDVPQFSPEAIERLRKIVPVSGTMVGNPLDAWQVFYKLSDGEGNIADVFKIIAGEDYIHTIILQFDQVKFMITMWGDKLEENFEIIAENTLKGCLYARDVLGKPVLISIGLDPYSENEMERKYSLIFKKRCEAIGFPMLPSLFEAVSTTSYLYKYMMLKEHHQASSIEQV